MGLVFGIEFFPLTNERRAGGFSSILTKGAIPLFLEGGKMFD
jgi:hypothetical protein